ncbi:MAG: hypothetical protein O6934_05320 [SAR324 cluster bacterium]|nr:hypothetical protein [SAR324 cluster bacterium]MCZ6729379.1 hypothetical protein [SAR324 cluster bacterium]
MNRKRITKAVLIFMACALLLSLPAASALPAKLGFFEKLKMLWISYSIGKYTEPFTIAEIEELREAMPTIKTKNPKLYKDQKKTEKILLLFMVLEEITLLEEAGQPMDSLVGKTRGEVAQAFVQRVYRGR